MSLVHRHAQIDSPRIVGEKSRFRQQWANWRRLVRTFPPLLQLRILRLGFLQDGDVGVSVFPESEEILVGSLRFGGVAGDGVGMG